LGNDERPGDAPQRSQLSKEAGWKGMWLHE
jgi:hypothetical protein